MAAGGYPFEPGGPGAFDIWDGPGGGGGGGGISGPQLGSAAGFVGGMAPGFRFGAPGGFAPPMRRLGMRPPYSALGPSQPQPSYGMQNGSGGYGTQQAGGMPMGVQGQGGASPMGSNNGMQWLTSIFPSLASHLPQSQQSAPGWNVSNDTSSPDWWAPGHDLGSISNIMQGLIRNAGAGGAFGMNPPQGIMDAMRQRAMSDYGAQQQQSRLALQANQGIDPSTYGFNSLMSQYQGQKGVQDQLGQGDLALRQQQLQFLQQLMGQGLGFQQGKEVATINRPRQGTDWGGIIGGIGNLF